jgi:hypothetical protein
MIVYHDENRWLVLRRPVLGDDASEISGDNAALIANSASFTVIVKCRASRKKKLADV